MIVIMLAATIVLQSTEMEVGYGPLLAGDTAGAIVAIGERVAQTDDPAGLINLGIAHARNDDRQKARALFAQAFYSREWVELETAAGNWVDSRTLARRALAMLDAGQLARTSQFAQK